MPAIEIRPAIATDIPYLMKINHSFSTEYVWQMDLNIDVEKINVNFRRTRLPRQVRHEYPRNPGRLADEWTHSSGFLVAIHNSEPVGYICMLLGIIPHTVMITDLAVALHLRYQGIGTALILAAQDWAVARGCQQASLEMQSKNYPGINLAQKLGYDFCGYSDRYYKNQDIALFFAKGLR